MNERFILLEEDLYNFRTTHFVVGDIKHRNGRYTRIGPLVDTLNEQDARIQELENKMNYQAFELYKYNVVSIGKAVELSNMSYHDFIKYCANNGHPVELRL